MGKGKLLPVSKSQMKTKDAGKSRRARRVQKEGASEFYSQGGGGRRRKQHFTEKKKKRARALRRSSQKGGREGVAGGGLLSHCVERKGGW